MRPLNIVKGSSRILFLLLILHGTDCFKSERSIDTCSNDNQMSTFKRELNSFCPRTDNRVIRKIRSTERIRVIGDGNQEDYPRVMSPKSSTLFDSERMRIRSMNYAERSRRIERSFTRQEERIKRFGNDQRQRQNERRYNEKIFERLSRNKADQRRGSMRRDANILRDMNGYRFSKPEMRREQSGYPINNRFSSSRSNSVDDKRFETRNGRENISRRNEITPNKNRMLSQVSERRDSSERSMNTRRNILNREQDFQGMQISRTSLRQSAYRADRSAFTKRETENNMRNSGIDKRARNSQRNSVLRIDSSRMKESVSRENSGRNQMRFSRDSRKSMSENPPEIQRRDSFTRNRYTNKRQNSFNRDERFYQSRDESRNIQRNEYILSHINPSNEHEELRINHRNVMTSKDGFGNRRINVLRESSIDRHGRILESSRRIVGKIEETVRRDLNRQGSQGIRPKRNSEIRNGSPERFQTRDGDKRNNEETERRASIRQGGQENRSRKNNKNRNSSTERFQTRDGDRIVRKNMEVRRTDTRATESLGRISEARRFIDNRLVANEKRDRRIMSRTIRGYETENRVIPESYYRTVNIKNGMDGKVPEDNTRSEKYRLNDSNRRNSRWNRLEQRTRFDMQRGQREYSREKRYMSVMRIVDMDITRKLVESRKLQQGLNRHHTPELMETNKFKDSLQMMSVNKNPDEMDATFTSKWFRTIQITLGVIVLGQLLLSTGHDKKKGIFPMLSLQKLKSF